MISGKLLRKAIEMVVRETETLQYLSVSQLFDACTQHTRTHARKEAYTHARPHAYKQAAC